MDKNIKIGIAIIVLLLLMIIPIYWKFNKDNANEHLTSLTYTTLSNEAIQNMGSVLNSGSGKVNNLEITGSLKIGNLTIDKDGNLNWPSGASINSSGRITYPKIGNGQWTCGLEGDLHVLRYQLTDANGKMINDNRFAHFGDAFTNFGGPASNTTMLGNLNVGKNINVSNDLLLNGHMYTNTGSTMNFKGPVLIGDGVNTWNLNSSGGKFYISPLNYNSDGWLTNQGLTITRAVSVQDGVRAVANNDVGPNGGTGAFVSNNAECINLCGNTPDATKALFFKTGKLCYCKNKDNVGTDPARANEYVTSGL